MTPTDSPLSPLGEMYPYSRHSEVLAARNATLRLRAPDGKVYSFTDLTCANGAVNFGHMNPAIDPFSSLTSDLVAGFYPSNAATYATWLSNKLKLSSHSVLYQVGASSAVSSAIAIAQRFRPGTRSPACSMSPSRPQMVTCRSRSHGCGPSPSPHRPQGSP